MADTSTTSASLAAPTIDAIRQLAVASAPAAAVPFINAQFATAPVAAPAAVAPAPAAGSPSVAGSSLAQPTISFIREQILANAPSAYFSAIAEQFTTAAASPAPPAAPVQPAASVAPALPAPTSDADSAVIGASLAAPAIALIREQITLLAPAEYSAAILAQFPAAPAASGDSPPPAAGATIPVPPAASAVQAYFAAQATPTA